MSPMVSAVVKEPTDRQICSCGNPAEHVRQPRPRRYRPGGKPGGYCWVEPELRPDGTRRMFPNLPDGQVPPLPTEAQQRQAAERYRVEHGREYYEPLPAGLAQEEEDKLGLGYYRRWGRETAERGGNPIPRKRNNRYVFKARQQWDAWTEGYESVGEN